MKILQIVSFYPPKIGGMEKIVKEIMENMTLKNFQIDVLTSSINQNNQISKKNINVKKTIMINKVPISFKAIFFLLKNYYHIFQIHLGVIFFPDLGFIIAKIKKIPIISHVHIDIQSYSILGKIFFYFYNKFWLKYVLEHSDAVIFPSKSFEDFFINKYKINIISEIIPVGFYYDKFKCQKIDEEDNPVIIFVGRLKEQKNVDVFIKGINLFMKIYNNNFESYVIGEGPQKESLNKLAAKLKIKNYIKFLGKISEKKLIDIYKKASFLILPSKIESAGIVLLEALASSTIVISSNVPGINSIIKNDFNGILIDKITPKKISDNLLRIISNKEKQEYLIKNGQKTAKKYDWNNIKNMYKNLYYKILKNKYNKKN
jgi:glycosyltransferase involved in cell wall biosynthesis